MKHKSLVVFGPPGIGKGTACKALVENFKNLYYIATGDLVREVLASEREPLASKFRDLLQQGILLSDSDINDLLIDHLNYAQNEGLYHQNKTILLDGFPRTTDQARMGSSVLDYRTVFHLTNVSRSELRSRIKSRASLHKLEGRPARDDDNSDAISRRLDDYFDSEEKLLWWYRNLTVPVVSVDASRSRIVVASDLYDRVESYFKRQ